MTNTNPMTDSPNLALAEEIERLALEGPLGAYAARHVFYEHWKDIVAALRAQPSGPKVYSTDQCDKHRGQTFMVGVYPVSPLPVVCPLCERDSAAKERGRP